MAALRIGAGSRAGTISAGPACNSTLPSRESADRAVLTEVHCGRTAEMRSNERRFGAVSRPS